jgi:hypothetical protein
MEVWRLCNTALVILLPTKHRTDESQRSFGQTLVQNLLFLAGWDPAYPVWHENNSSGPLTDDQIRLEALHVLLAIASSTLAAAPKPYLPLFWT